MLGASPQGVTCIVWPAQCPYRSVHAACWRRSEDARRPPRFKTGSAGARPARPCCETHRQRRLKSASPKGDRAVEARDSPRACRAEDRPRMSDGLEVRACQTAPRPGKGMLPLWASGHAAKAPGRAGCQWAARHICRPRAPHPFKVSRPARSSRIGQSGRSSPWQRVTRVSSVDFSRCNSSIFCAMRSRCSEASALTSALARSRSS